jgi:hypothetical protein
MSKILPDMTAPPLKSRAPKSKLKHIRNAVIKMGLMSPEKRKDYVPKNGFEEAAKTAFDTATKGKTTSSVTALKNIQEMLGEKATDASTKPVTDFNLRD